MTYDEIIRLLKSNNTDDVKKALLYIKKLITKGESVSDELLILMLKSNLKGIDDAALRYIIDEKQNNITSKLRIPSHIEENEMFNYALYQLWRFVRRRDFDTSKTDAIERFLFVICRRYIIKKSGKGDTNIDKLPESSDNMPPLLHDYEVYEAMREVFDTLGRGCKEILTYRYFAEMSYKEIAEIADYTKDSARVRASNCMKKLRQAVFNNPSLGSYIRGLLN